MSFSVANANGTIDSDPVNPITFLAKRSDSRSLLDVAESEQRAAVSLPHPPHTDSDRLPSLLRFLQLLAKKRGNS